VDRVEAVVAAGMPSYRAKQIAAHYFDHWSAEPKSWTDLSAAHRQLAGQFFPTLLDPVTSRQCDAGATVKSLYRLFDGSLVEAVLMRYGLQADGRPGPRGVRSTLCLSSQVGCGMGCPFCATGQLGLTRNLSTGEIVEQVRWAGQVLESGAVPGGSGRLHNIVFMGMGEPLANYDAVLAAIRTLIGSGRVGFGLSARGITVSTVGLVPRIERLAAEGLPVTLAVSLHAPDDELRDTLVPVNRRWPVAAVLDAAWHYAQTTRRRVSIEYALIRDINDQASRADQLAEALKRRGTWGWCHVNLIPLNPTPGSRWTASRPQSQAAFVRRLETHGIPVTVRDTRGRDIEGACGQLAAQITAASGANARPGDPMAAEPGQDAVGGKNFVLIQN
jgi:23S rRNA (adenine2503-C2)-methyltransferase